MPPQRQEDNHILYPIRDLGLGLYTRGDITQRPPNSCSELLNKVWKEDVWMRKGGRSKYNSSAMHATEEGRGLFTFNNGTINCMLAICNAKFFKTTGDGSMGSALTEPDGTAVTIASANNDFYACQIANRLYLWNGDTADEPWVFEGTNIINYSRDATSGTADAAGTTTTIKDADFGGAPGDDDYNGQYIEITDAGDGTVYRGYVTDFAQVAPRTITFSPARSTATAIGDTFTVGVAGQEERNGRFAIVHKERIFVAVDSLAYWTEAYYPDIWNSIATGDPNIEKIGYQDQEKITGVASLDDYVIFFKPHNIYAMRVIGNPPWVVTKITGRNADRGAVWGKTIGRGFGGLVYYSWDGAYLLDRGLNVYCLSRNIEPTFQGLIQSISDPFLTSLVEKIDTLKADFDAGTATNIDTATESGTFRVAKTAEAVEQQYASGQDDSWCLGAGVPLGYQSFTTSKACIATRIELYLKRTAGESGTCYFYLYDDNGNKPGNQIGSATFAIGSIGTDYGFISFDITDLNLANTTKYWISAYSGTKYVYWGLDISSPTYAGGNFYYNNTHYTDWDALFKVSEQHYESSSNLISQKFDLGATPSSWGKFEATVTLNGCSIAWQIATDDDVNWGSPTAWSNVENGGTPSVTLQRYVKYKATNTPTNTATPVVSDVTIRAYISNPPVSPHAIMWKKGYELCVQDTGSSTNNVVYRLDEEAFLYEGVEKWTKKDGIEANQFVVFNNQLMSISVGGTGKGGYIYYEDTGDKDLGSDFTSRIVTQKLDFSNMNPTYRERDKIYRKAISKYKSQQDASFYYKVDNGDWSSAITLSAKANAGIEEDWLGTAPRGIYIQIKVENTTADSDFEFHGLDIKSEVQELK